jgi:hypothetical protein
MRIRFKFPFDVVRPACFAAAFVASAVVMAAVGSAFDRVSRSPWVRDSPQARAVAAECAGRPSREARRECARRYVAAVQAREGGVRVAVAQPQE